MNRDDKKIQTRPHKTPGCLFVQNPNSTPDPNSSAAKAGLYVCTQCAFTTLDEGQKEQHLRMHDPKHIAMHCEIPNCGFWTYSEEEWQKHFNQHDPNDRLWYCPHCGVMWEYPSDANLCCSEDGLYVQICKACHGYKSYLGKPCPNCEGTGFAPPGQEWNDSHLRRPRFITCPGCGGTGKGTLGIFKCGVCDGKQKVIDGSFKCLPSYSLSRHGSIEVKTLIHKDAAERPEGYPVLKHHRRDY